MPDSISNSSVVQALSAVLALVIGLLGSFAAWVGVRNIGRIDYLEKSSQYNKINLAKSNEKFSMALTALGETVERNERQHKERIDSDRRETSRRLAYLEKMHEQSRMDLKELFDKHAQNLERIISNR